MFSISQTGSVGSKIAIEVVDTKIVAEIIFIDLSLNNDHKVVGIVIALPSSNNSCV